MNALNEVAALAKQISDAQDQLAAATERIGPVLRTMRENHDGNLNEALTVAYDAGLTLQTIGDMLGVTREAVRLRIARGASAEPLFPYQVPPAVEARLREIAPVAREVRYQHAPDSRTRLARAELLELLQALRAKRVHQRRVARMLGTGMDAVAARLRGLPRISTAAADAILARYTDGQS